MGKDLTKIKLLEDNIAITKEIKNILIKQEWEPDTVKYINMLIATVWDNIRDVFNLTTEKFDIYAIKDNILLYAKDEVSNILISKAEINAKGMLEFYKDEQKFIDDYHLLYENESAPKIILDKLITMYMTNVNAALVESVHRRRKLE